MRDTPLADGRPSLFPKKAAIFLATVTENRPGSLSARAVFFAPVFLCQKTPGVFCPFFPNTDRSAVAQKMSNPNCSKNEQFFGADRSRFFVDFERVLEERSQTQAWQRVQRALFRACIPLHLLRSPRQNTAMTNYNTLSNNAARRSALCDASVMTIGNGSARHCAPERHDDSMTDAQTATRTRKGEFTDELSSVDTIDSREPQQRAKARVWV